MAARSALLGEQTATTRLLPPGRADDAAAQLARRLGMDLLPWQSEILTESARTGRDGRWSAFETTVIAPRQNGKSFLILARALAGALLYDEKLILYSAHEYRTAQEVWRTLLELARGEPLSRYVRKLYTASGREGIEFVNGARFRLIARTRSSIRGMFPDCVLIDEAFAVSEEVMASVIPSMAARPNPQVFYFSSAATWEALVLLGLRQRGHRQSTKHYAYWEWHAEPDCDHRDPKVWRCANPSYGRLISKQAIERELEAMTRRAFLRERLGVWSESTVDAVLDEQRVSDLVVPVPKPPRDDRPVAWGVDVAHDRSGASIVAAFHGADGYPVLTLVDSRPGAGWLPGRLAELVETRGLESVTYDAGGGLADLMEWAARTHDVPVAPLKHQDYPTACAGLAQRVSDATVRFAAAPPLISDATGAIARVMRTGWVWDRKTATPPTNLIAATCALYALERGSGADAVGVF